MSNRATIFSATLGEDRKIEPPLGPLYIAAALQSVDWEIDFRDYQLCDGANAFDPELMYQCLRGHESILMISCFVDMLPVVIAAAELIKRDKPNTYIILGGPGPTAGAAEFLQFFSCLDAIVMGEGEETIKEWARIYSTSDTVQQPIAGMVHRTESGIVSGPPRQRIADGDAIPLPAYRLIDWSRYSAARVITTRGCPYHCSFCDVAPLWGRKAVYRDIHRTIDEMVLLRDHYGKRSIAVVDDTFVLNRERVRAFCLELITRRANLDWGCFGRINLMSEDLIELMAIAGCRAIFYGIDSGSPAILKRTYKEISCESIVPTLRMSAQYFDAIEASFIWGYPFESFGDFACTIDMAAEASTLAPKVNVQLHMLSPLPSSPIFKEFPNELIIPDPKDRPWLLLPSLLFDSRAEKVRAIIHRRPQLFPGFFAFRTPEKERKRAELIAVQSSLNALLGRTLLDASVRGMLESPNLELETQLLNECISPADRIGIGIGLGVFRRSRLRFASGMTSSHSGQRGPSLVRERNDLVRGEL